MKPVPLVGAVALAAFLLVAPAQARADAAGRRRRSPSLALLVYGSGLVELPERREAARGRRARRSARGPTWSSACSPSSRPARSSGCSRPGETAMIVGGVVAGQGEIDARRADRDRLGLRRRRRPDELLRSAAGSGAAFLVKHGPKVSDHRGAPRTRSRASSSATAARRSSSGASSASCARSRRSWPARRGMPLRRFLPYDVLGAGAVGDDVLLARLRLLAELRQASSTTPSKGALALGTVDRGRRRRIVWLCRWLRERRAPRAAARGSTAARPAGAAAAGRGRCGRCGAVARGRGASSGTASRPGELGLELTTLLAVARASARSPSSGLRRRRSTTSALDRRRRRARSTSADDLRARPARRRREGRHRRSARCAVVGVAARARGGRCSCAARRAIEAVALVAGLLLTYGVVHVAKAAEDRPRPAEPARRRPRASSFPSGHAAYAVALGRDRGRRSAARCPGCARGAALVVAAVVLAVAVGADARLPARALPLRRRSAGAGLAAAIFAAVRHGARWSSAIVRHNGAPRMSNESITYLVAAVLRRLRPRRLRRR